ncbi:efflux transporter outer membrane subunit [Piscinibacter terrae]|uniref:RND transporter n=1 Tax=Piscinibacter terrae TaxID=2496871 RepID=A0A3N7K1G0_9BURK|nr:efflux transporter outer membrane subunit [Albitalea terrae]RQP24795.1 RND transporter [Albitalea terrae]
MKTVFSLTSLCAALLLAGCAQAPRQETPSTPTSAAFKEAPPGWLNAAPADALERGPWWALFNDPALTALMDRVAVSNQNVAASAAAYAQAQAAVREQRASLFPSLGLSAGASRSGGGETSANSRYTLGLSGSWEPDLWGRLRGGVDSAGARAQASAADLAAATLSAQGELATSYFSLRETDAEAQMLRKTIEGYEQAARITQNRYNAGVVPRSDLLQAQTQLSNARADLAGLDRQRAQLEHAMAVLVGEAPANFSVPAVEWTWPALPAVPGVLPSALLQRRPDVAAAERRVAAANASIGVARAAFFPDFSLSGNYGLGSAKLGDLFSASAVTWSLGLSVVQTLFDAGARSARVDEAKASWEQSVAQYRQAVLIAFQDVEDQLAAVRILEQQEALRRQASEAADLTEQQVMNRYQAGQVGYSDVVIAQITALSTRRSLAQAVANRQTAAVGLIRALGGGWKS